MKKWILSFLTIVICVTLCCAQPAVKASKTKILLLGTFHFSNPGLDVAKYESANVLSEKRQKEILEVVKQLKDFKPDQIFIEATPRYQPYYDSLLQVYKNGQYQLKADETNQLGLRLAKELNVNSLQCVDYNGAVFPFDSLVKVISSEKQFSLLEYMKKTIDSIQTAHNNQLKTATIKQMLINGNSKQDREFSVGGYFEFLKAGGKDNHVGSYLVSEWWRRNMIIYENILKRLTTNDKKVLVIFGGSHTALLHEFMKYNPTIELVQIEKVLK